MLPMALDYDINTLYTMHNTIYGKGMRNLLPRIEETSGGKAHRNTGKLIQNILMFKNVFLNQKRVNVCEHTAKMTSLEAIRGL